MEKNNIAGFFPLHNLKRKQELSDAIFTLRTFPWDFPLFRMKVRSIIYLKDDVVVRLLMFDVAFALIRVRSIMVKRSASILLLWVILASG